MPTSKPTLPLTRRAFALGLPASAVGPLAARAEESRKATAAVLAMLERWQALRAAMDLPAGDQEDAHADIEDPAL